MTSERRTPVVVAVAGAKDSVVNIHGQKTLTSEEPSAHADAPRRVNGMGTGIVIDERGYIVTNFHVVDGVQKIEVTMADGANYMAKLISSDATADLAVIKIATPKKLKVISIGTSSDLMVGEPIIAVGNAYGYENTVTEGIVSALHRNVQVSETQGYDDLVQVSAAINPGNSGGPLLNIDGEMVGVNVAVRAGAQGIGFAIPADKAMSVAAKLISVERLDNHWHGIVYRDSAGEKPGAIVASVQKESPAAQMGLKSGDVIIAVGAQDIARPLDLERALLDRKTGEEVAITVRRNDRDEKLSMTLAALPSRPATAADMPWDMLGLKLSPMAVAQFKQFQSRYRGGLTVNDVRADGPAAKQGIRKGDVLVGLHEWETISLENVNYILNRSDLSDFEPMKFYILRGNDSWFGRLSVASQKKSSARE